MNNREENFFLRINAIESKFYFFRRKTLFNLKLSYITICNEYITGNFSFNALDII